MSRRRPSANLPFLRRRSTPWLIGGVVLLVIAGILSAVSRSGSGPHQDAESTATRVTAGSAAFTPVAEGATASPSFVAPDLHPDPALLEAAHVVHVVDGDTIDVEINGREERVRYYGIDTPERGDACFSEATARNKELIDGSVLLLPDVRDRDRYGRLLRYVFDAEGDSVDARLIAEGLARAWRADGTYRDPLVVLEEQADEAAIGCLWGGG